MGLAHMEPRERYEWLSPYVLQLNGAKGRPGGPIRARCPAHDDKQASLSLHPEYGLTCYVGCTYEAMLKAMNVESPAASRRAEQTQKRGSFGPPSARYDYKDEAGNLIATKCRWNLPNGKKTFTWKVAGAEDWGLDETGQRDLPLYHADEVAKADPSVTVYFCEGEKAADACREHGLLAVSHGGGAGIKDFGDKLDILRGRPVVNLADNDPQGRGFVHVLAKALRGIARSVKIVSLPVPEHGDAYDYFESGGKAEDIERQSGKLLVEYLDTDAIRVTVPTTEGTAVFNFTDLSPRARGLDAEVAVSTDANPDESYAVRMDLLRQSDQESLKRSMKELYGEGHDWTRVINTAINKARVGISKIQTPELLADVEPPGSIPYLIQSVIPDRVVTIIFGDQQSLKTYLVYYQALCIATGRPFLGDIPVDQGGVLVLDWEMDKGYASRRFRRLMAGMEIDEFPRNIHYFNCGGMSMRDVVREVRPMITGEGIRYTIADSIVPSCGGDPLNNEIAADWFKSTDKIKAAGSAIVGIAHITKSQSGRDDIQKPFGAAYWSYEARATIYVARSQQGELMHQDRASIVLHTRKMGESKLPRPMGIQVDFDGESGPVAFRHMSNDAPAEGSLSERIWESVRIAKTVDEIAAMVGATADACRKTMERNPGRFQRREIGGGAGNKTVWQRGSHDSEPIAADEDGLPF